MSAKPRVNHLHKGTVIEPFMYDPHTVQRLKSLHLAEVENKKLVVQRACKIVQFADGNDKLYYYQ